MKHVILLFLFALSVVYAVGCGNSTTGPLLGSVDFTMSSGTGGNGIYIAFKPSEDIHLSRIIRNCVSPSYADTVTLSTSYNYSKDSSYFAVPDDPFVQTGQQWKFWFTGTTTASSSAFTNVQKDFTVP